MLMPSSKTYSLIVPLKKLHKTPICPGLIMTNILVPTKITRKTINNKISAILDVTLLFFMTSSFETITSPIDIYNMTSTKENSRAITLPV